MGFMFCDLHVSLSKPSSGDTNSTSSKAVVLLSLIHCLMHFPLFMGALCLSLFCYALVGVLSSFAIILKRKRELVILLLLFYGCFVTVNVM